MRRLDHDAVGVAEDHAHRLRGERSAISRSTGSAARMSSESPSGPGSRSGRGGRADLPEAGPGPAREDRLPDGPGRTGSSTRNEVRRGRRPHRPWTAAAAPGPPRGSGHRPLRHGHRSPPSPRRSGAPRGAPPGGDARTDHSREGKPRNEGIPRRLKLRPLRRAGTKWNPGTRRRRRSAPRRSPASRTSGVRGARARRGFRGTRTRPRIASRRPEPTARGSRPSPRPQP